jgi:hypothetical protein
MNKNTIETSILKTAGGGGGGIKMFAKLVNKNAIKHQKGVPSPQNFHNPYENQTLYIYDR